MCNIKIGDDVSGLVVAGIPNRDIAELSLKDSIAQVIAGKMGISNWTVYRRLNLNHALTSQRTPYDQVGD